MKRVILVIGMAVLAAGCSGSSNSSSSGATSTTSGTTTGGSTSSTSTSSTSTTGSTGQTTSTSTSSGSTGTTTSSTTSSGSGGSSGSSGTGPANDACTGAVALTVHAPGDTQTVTGDTSTASDDYESPSCGGYGGDVFYTLHLTAEAQVTAALTPGNASNDSVVDILTGCAGTEVRCAASASPGTAANLSYGHLAAGDYVIVVDNFSGEDGPFSLTVTIANPVAPPANNDCSGTIPALAVNTPVSGDTSNADDSFSITYYAADGGGAPGCPDAFLPGTGTAPDLVYSFTPATDGTYVFAVTPDQNFDAALYLVGACTDGAQNSCVGGSDNQGAGGKETFTATLTHGTTYYLIVDGYGGSAGTFSVSVTTPPDNDQCASAAALDVDGGTAMATGDTSIAGNEYQSSTCSSSAGDVFYGFSIGAASRVTATVTPDSTGAPSVALITGCPFPDAGGAELACSDAVDIGTASVLDIPSVPAGSYTLVVDSINGQTGPLGSPFTLDLQIAAPYTTVPANDTCTSPTTIALSTLGDGGTYGEATFNAFNGADDIQPSSTGNCSQNGVPLYKSASDVVFQVAVPANAPSITATWVYPDGGMDVGTAAIIATDGPCGTGAELNCGVSPLTITAADGGNPSGTVYIWVDQAKGLQAPSGTLQVTVP